MGIAKFSAHALVFEQLFHLPDGYSIVDVSYDPKNKLIHFTVMSTKPADWDGARDAELVMHMESLVGHPDYKKLTGEIKLL